MSWQPRTWSSSHISTRARLIPISTHCPWTNFLKTKRPVAVTVASAASPKRGAHVSTLNATHNPNTTRPAHPMAVLLLDAVVDRMAVLLLTLRAFEIGSRSSPVDSSLAGEAHGSPRGTQGLLGGIPRDLRGPPLPSASPRQ